MRERVTQWLDERPIRLAVVFAVVAVLMAVASADAWLDPASSWAARRAGAKFLGPLLAVLCALGAIKLWRLDASERPGHRRQPR
jgi:hypothetical protein